MRCPTCLAQTAVVDSRRKDAGTYRRRACPCGAKFSTMEAVIPARQAKPKPAKVRRTPQVRTSWHPPKPPLSEAAELEKLVAAQAQDMRWPTDVRTGGSGVSVRAAQSLDYAVDGRAFMHDITG